MKKVVLILLVIALLTPHLFAEPVNEVSLRFSRADTRMRIVLESGEDFIRNANTIASPSYIKIEFPGDFDFKRPPEFDVEIVKKGRVLLFNLKNVIDVKTYKLYSPPRLVFDLLGITNETGTSSLPRQSDGPAADKQESNSAPKGPLSGFFQGSKPQVPEVAGAEHHELKTVVLDAGHGGYDYGIVLNGANEKEGDLNLAKDLRYILARKGLRTFITRSADQYVSLYDRIIFANGKKPDLFISLHSGASSKQSFAVYAASVEDRNVDALTELYSLSSRQNRHIDDSRDAAVSLGEAIKRELKADVVLRRLPLPILESIDAPAVMIEYPSSASYYSDPKTRERLVSAIIKGLEDYEK